MPFNYCCMTMAAAVFAIALFCAEAFAQETRLNLILGDGTVLIYKTAETGYVEGQNLNVIRHGEVVGTVVITKTHPSYSQAIIVSGKDAIHEYDVVAPGAQTTRANEIVALVEPEPAILEIRHYAAPPPVEIVAASAPAEQTSEQSPSARRDSRRDSANASAAQATPPVKSVPVKTIPTTAIVSHSSPWVIRAGYLFFNQSIPNAISTSSDPTLTIGLDYWRPKREFRSVVYSLSYSKPETINRFTDYLARSEYEILQLSINYIWSDFNSKHYGKTGLYGGVGAGYALATAHMNCEGACAGVSQPQEESIEGIGYYGTLGYRFHKNYELKLDYRFDKEYFAVTFGTGGKKKRVAMIFEAPPEPEPAIEPVPATIIREEPKPAPIVEKDVWTYSEFEKPVPEPVVIIVSEPEVEKKVYYYVAQPEIEKKIIILALEDVFFDFDQSTLTSVARAILKRNIQILKENPRVRVRIAGYTSASGTTEYNQKLSERRAKAVKDYLVEEGLISSDRLVTIGFGKSDPATFEVAPKDLYSDAAKSNMRVLFEIILN